MAETTAAVQSGPKPLTNAIKFWYGFGDFGFTLMTNVETFYFNSFLTSNFTVGVTTIISLIYSWVDVVLCWVWGGFINAVKPKKWGRYRSWLIMLPWIVPIIYAFQFLKISDNVALSATIITVAACLSHQIWNIPYSANASLVAVCGKTPEDRATLASSRATWNNLSSVIFGYVGLPLATVLAGVIGEAYKWAAVCFILGVVMAIGYWVHFKVSAPYEEPEAPDAPKAQQTKVIDMLKGLVQNPHLILLIVADFAKWLVKFLVAASAIYYFAYAMGTKLQVTYVLVANIAAVIGAYCARYLLKALTNRVAIICAYLVMGAAMILAYFFFANPVLVLVLMAIAQMLYGVCYAAAPALYADAAVYAEWKTGKSCIGWVMGLQTLPLKVGVLVRAVILNACLAAVSFDSVKEALGAVKDIARDVSGVSNLAEVQQGITAAFSLWPGLFCIAGALILLFGYRLTREKVMKYQADIDARKGQ